MGLLVLSLNACGKIEVVTSISQILARLLGLSIVWMFIYKDNNEQARASTLITQLIIKFLD